MTSSAARAGAGGTFTRPAFNTLPWFKAKRVPVTLLQWRWSEKGLKSRKNLSKLSLSRHIFRWIILKFWVCIMTKCLSDVSHTLFHLHLAHAVIQTLNLNDIFYQFMLVCVCVSMCMWVCVFTSVCVCADTCWYHHIRWSFRENRQEKIWSNPPALENTYARCVRESVLTESAQFKPPPRAAIRRRDEKADFLRISMISGNTKSIPVLVRPRLIALNCQKMAESNGKCWRLQDWFAEEEMARAIDTALETIIGLSERNSSRTTGARTHLHSISTHPRARNV